MVWQPGHLGNMAAGCEQAACQGLHGVGPLVLFQAELAGEPVRSRMGWRNTKRVA
jgi:hypothetical protein